MVMVLGTGTANAIPQPPGDGDPLPDDCVASTTAELSVSPQTITYGQSVTVSWNVEQLPGCTVWKRIDGPGFGGESVSNTGSRTVVPHSGGTQSWTLTVSGPAGNSYPIGSATATVQSAPVSPWNIVGAGPGLLWHNDQTNETQFWTTDSSEGRAGVVFRHVIRDENGNPIYVGGPWSIAGQGSYLGQDGQEIFWRNSQTNETQIWFIGSNYQISTRHWIADESGQPIYIGLPWSIADTKDLDGDGKADIVWHNSQTNETQIWFLDGYRIVRRANVVDEAGNPIFIGQPWSIAAAGNLDRDLYGPLHLYDKSDLVWHNSQTNETQIWFMDGNRIRQRATVVDEAGHPIFIGQPWNIVGAGDLIETSSEEDIVWYNSQTGETQIWFMDGNRITGRSNVADLQPPPAATGHLNVPFANGYSHLPTTYVVEDCRQTGMNQEPDHPHAYINLRSPGPGGTSARWTWGGTLYTVSFVFMDVWRQRWEFKDAQGQVVLTLTANGPEMYRGEYFNPQGLYYAPPGPVIQGTVPLTESQWRSITSVDWYADDC